MKNIKIQKHNQSFSFSVFLFFCFLMILLGVLGIARVSLAVTYYIAPSPTGSDTNLGTSAAPWATFSKAFSVMTGGDTLIVKDGTYNQSLKNPPSGTTGGYTTVKAENNFKPIIDGEGISDPALYIQNGRHHIQIEGFHFRNGNISGNTEVANIGRDLKCCDQGVPTDGAYYITMVRNIIQGRNRSETDIYSSMLTISVSSNITIEENIAFGKTNKYTFMAYKSSNVIMRRNFTRWDAVNPLTQGNNHPSASFTFYDTKDSILENNIAVDGQHTADSGTAAFFMAAHYIGCDNNKWVGNIAINNIGNSAFHLDTGPNYRSDQVPWTCNNQLISNNVGWLSNNGGGVGINMGLELVGPYIDNVTISHNTVGGNKSVGGNGILIYHNPSNVTFKNNVILSNETAYYCSYSTLNLIYSIMFDYSIEKKGSGCTYNVTNNLFANPNLLYLTRIESGSTAKGTADDGGDMGANIIKRYESGVLTTTDLWPFPNEDIIKKVVCADIGETRGFCSSTTLTAYIWEYLGNPIPPEIYGSTPDTTPPSAPTGLTVN